MILKDFRSIIRSNIRDYGMYIALIVIMGIFTIATGGVFISSRNIANLLNQTGYIAVLAIGIGGTVAGACLHSRASSVATTARHSLP